MIEIYLNNRYCRVITVLILCIFIIQPSEVNAQIKGRVISEQDKTSLPYASIYTTSGQFTFTNDDGYFTLKGNLGQRVNITFLGFRDTSIIINKQNLTIQLKNDGFVTEEVVISDKNYISPYKTLAKAIKQYKKEDKDEVQTKLFVKRESVNSGVWADQTEVLYNYTHKNRRIYDWKFKHGKSFINVNNDLILTLDLFEVMKKDWIFDKKTSSLYQSIVTQSSAKKMVKKYDASYSEYTSNGKEYFVINSIPLQTSESFSSKITVDKATNDFVEIVNTIEEPKVVQFKSIRTGKPIEMTRMQFSYKFVQYMEMTFLSHIDVSYTYFLNGIESQNSLAFHFYDHGNPFIENQTSIKYLPLTDYQKVWVTPYSENFWREQNIVESQLDTLTNYMYLSTKIKSLLQNKPYLSLSDVFNAESDLLVHPPRMNDGSAMKAKVDLMDIKTQLHINAFFHINPYYKDDEIQYEVSPLINYNRSFIYKTSPLIILQMEKELKIIKDHTEMFQNEINAKLATEELSKKELTSLSDKHHQNLWRALSELDNYQFLNWEPYNQHEALEKFKRQRF